MTNTDFNIDDLEGPEFGGAPVARGPVTYTELGGHYEACPKCRGTGQTRWGVCFKCQGKGGKTFKQPAAVRAVAREQLADRKDRKAQENLDRFAAAYPAEWAWLTSRIDWEIRKDAGDFGRSLREGIAKYGDLTEKQLAAVRTNLAKRAAAIEAAGQRVDVAPKISVERIEQAFATAAANGLKKLKLRLATTTTVEGKQVLKNAYVFTPAPATGKNPGAIYVKTSGDEYLGKVVAGAFRCVATCGDERRDEIVAVAGDPAQAAIAYGRVLGACAICGRELSDPESVARGIGPVCAERYAF